MSKKEDVLDLATLDTVSACEKGAEFELKHPVTSAPLGIFITVLGKDSNTFRDHVRQSINDDLRRAAQAKKRGKEDVVRTVEEGEQRNLELLIICTTGWRTGDKQTITFKGEDLPFSISNAKTLYTGLPWIRAQVDEAIADIENFMKS